MLAWVGKDADVTINIGDVREFDICARGTDTGLIVAPTEHGYFGTKPRILGDGESELQGTIKVTCKNGRKAEKRISIRPTPNNYLDILVY